MQFNLNQVKNQTPAIVKRIRDSLLFMVSGSLVATTVLAPLFNVPPEDFATWAGVVLLVVRGVSMMFGVTDEQAMEQAKKTIERIEEKKQD